jgi:hypothetical protein
MDFSYNAFRQGKLKTKKVGIDLSYSTFLANQRKTEEITTEKAQRIEQGLPTSVFSGRAEPNLAEKIAQGIVRPAADVLTNVENSLRAVAGKEKLKVAKNKWLGDIKGLGEVDTSKSPFAKENLKVILNSASTGVELASYLTAGGVAKDTVAGLTARGVLASKNTFAEWVVTQFPKLAKEGFIQGLAYTAGSQGREYVASGTKPSLGQAVTDIGLSTIGSVAIPAVLQKTFGTSTKKILNARETERAIADARILGRKVPDVATKFDNAPKPSAGNILDNIFNPTQTTIPPNINTREGAFVETPIPKPKTQMEIRALANENKLDFIGQEIQALQRQNKKIPTNLQKQADAAWEKMHPVADTSKIKTYSVPVKTKPKDLSYKQFLEEKAQTGTPAGTSSTTPIGNTVPGNSAPKAENQLLKDVQKMADDFEGQNFEGFEPGNLAQFSQDIRKLDTEEIMNVAMGGKKTTDNLIPANAYLSVAKNIAEETGDIKMMKELASSNVASKTGQGLVSSKLTTTGNIVDDLRDVVLQKLRNKKLDETRLTQEQRVLFEKVKDRLVEYTKATKQEADNIISSLICK